MPRAVVVGCGYVGEPLADSLHGAGWEVEAWTASVESAARLSTKPYVVVARDIAANLRPAAPADVVVQCVSTRGGAIDEYERVYFEGARHLAAAFPAATLLFTSSTGVYAQTDGEWVTEESAAAPTRGSAQVLRRTEELVLDRHGIVARIAGIYGPGRSALLRKFLRNEAVVSEEYDYYVNQVHRDDIVTALRTLIDRRETVCGEVFNVVDNQPLLSRHCYETLARLLDRPLPPTASEPRQRKRGATNKRVSNAKLRKLGWEPRFPTFERGMAESVLPAWST